MKPLSTETTISKNRFALVAFVGAFVFFAFITWCTPYSSDDLEFAYLNFPTIGGYFDFALYYGNGRLLGNIFGVLMSSSKILCVLIKAFILSSAVILAPKVIGLQNKSCCLLSFLLLCTMTPSVLGEAIIWTSGFSNYVPPIWLTLLIIFMIQRESSAKGILKILLWFAVPVLGIASQLFVEHSSGVNGLLAFCFLIYYFRKGEKNKAVLCLLWLISLTVGLGLMLLIPKLFHRAGNRVDGYRQTYLGSLPTMIIGCSKNAIHLLNFYFGACEIPLCFGAAMTVLKTKENRTARANRILLGSVFLASMYLGLSVLISVNGYYGKSAFLQSILSGGSVLVPLIVWIIGALKLEPVTRRSQLFLLAFAIISMMPLLFVLPSPPRGILQSYVFVILAALQCFDWFDPKLSKQLHTLLLTASLTLAVLLGVVFYGIHNMAAARDAHIRQEVAKGSTEIEFFVLPYEYTSSWDHLWSFFYTYTGGKEITFDEIDFHSWMNSYYK